MAQKYRVKRDEENGILMNKYFDSYEEALTFVCEAGIPEDRIETTDVDGFTGTHIEVPV